MPKNTLSRSGRTWALGSIASVWLLGLGILPCGFPPPAGAQQVLDLPAPSSGSIRGTVVDPRGTPVSAARVKLFGANPALDREVLTDDTGEFSFEDLSAGPFRLAVTAEGFSEQTFSGTVRSRETSVVPEIMLAVATSVTEVKVVASQIELAEEQIKEQEKQRVLGVIPNFYVSYIPDAVPLSSKQKFKLALRTTIDPVTFGITGAVAGIEQAENEFSGFGQGAEGYAKRYGAAYADTVIGTFLGSAILPSLLKQDPRYFYKGTGGTRTRILYAMANAVICKGDNGHWQPNYSGILGGFAAGGISTLYYPSEHKEYELVVENTLIGIGATAAVNLLQEFLIRRLTPNLPKHNSASP